jgi:hypothetical protein
MLVLIGGLNSSELDWLIPRLTKKFDKHHFTGKSLKTGRIVDTQHSLDLIDTGRKFLEGRDNIDGLGVIIADSGQDSADVSGQFFPFALFRRTYIEPDLRMVERNSSHSRLQNKIEDSFNSLLSAKKQIKSHIDSTARKSALFLPVRHFDAAELTHLLYSLSLYQGPRAELRETLSQEEDKFKKKYGLKKIRRGYDRYINSKNIHFHFPGRALHGKVRYTPDHFPSCFLNGRFRLGVPIPNGFHYDCTRINGKKHYGTFKDCHNALGDYTGNPHLNVYPNDYIR